MELSDRAVKFIASWEDLFLQSYDDADDRIVRPGDHWLGVLTIGYGHTSAAGSPEVYPGMTCSEAEALAWLKADLYRVDAEVKKFVTVALTQQQYDGVGSFQYNTGWLGHSGCSLTKALNAGRMSVAAADFALYDEASGRVLRGLIRRRHAERDIFVAGVYVGSSGETIA